MRVAFVKKNRMPWLTSTVATVPHSLLRNTMRFLSDLRFENMVEFLEAKLRERGFPQDWPPRSLYLSTVPISYRLGFPTPAAGVSPW